jgi:hypothetical protein
MRYTTTALLALVFALNGCGGPEHRILGTDIPLVPGTALKNKDFTTARGKVQSGQATFTGSIFDALERARWTARGFEIDGWTQESLTGTPEQAVAIFTQAVPKTDKERVATMTVVASQVRGTATIVVTDRTVKPPASAPKDTAGSDSSTKDTTEDTTKDTTKDT